MTLQEAIAHARATAGRCGEGSMCARDHEQLADWLEELQRYRDTGLEPCDYSAMSHALQEAKRAKEDLTEMIRIIGGIDLDRLKELAQADKDGRLVVLPCKVGDTAYILRPGKKGVAVREVRVEDISISAKGFAILKFGFHYDSAFANDIGKSWFLTREEAEAALVADINVGSKEGDESDE